MLDRLRHDIRFGFAGRDEIAIKTDISAFKRFWHSYSPFTALRSIVQAGQRTGKTNYSSSSWALTRPEATASSMTFWAKLCGSGS